MGDLGQFTMMKSALGRIEETVTTRLLPHHVISLGHSPFGWMVPAVRLLIASTIASGGLASAF